LEVERWLRACTGYIARGHGRAPTHGPRLPASQQPERHQQILAGNVQDQANRTRKAGRRDSAGRNPFKPQSCESWPWLCLIFRRHLAAPLKSSMMCHAGTRQLSRRTYAISRPGHGVGISSDCGRSTRALELAHLPYKNGKTFEAYIGDSALKRRGQKKWTKSVFDVVTKLKNALQADYVVLGGWKRKTA
jgi:hypothetical protein